MLETVARGLPSVVTPILAGQMGWPDGTGYRVHDWHDPAGASPRRWRISTRTRPPGRRCSAPASPRSAASSDAEAYRAVLRRLCEAPTFA